MNANFATQNDWQGEVAWYAQRPGTYPIVVEVKRDAESQLILNHLFKLTQMQESFGVIMLSIVKGQPRELPIMDMLRLFIEHRIEVVRRRTQFELRKAEDREHILLGFNPDEMRKVL